jgi:hypothetical protein
MRLQTSGAASGSGVIAGKKEFSDVIATRARQNS